MPASHDDPTHTLERNELPLPIALLVSAVLTGLLVFLAASLLHRAKPIPTSIAPTSVPLHVVMVQLPAPPPQAAPSPDALAPPPPRPAVLPTTPTGLILLPPAAPTAATSPPKPFRRMQHPRHARTVTHASKPAPPAPAIPSSPSPVPPAAPARQASGDPAARDSLQARIKQAIQAAFRFPEAAREMGIHGTAQVGFTYRNQAASGIHLVASSGFAVLDHAALSFVRDASMPPPGKMAGQSLSLVVPVSFDITEDDD